MFARRIKIAANILKAPPSWNASRRCFATTDETAKQDPARKLLDGTTKIKDLTTKELKAALEYRNLSYKDCFDRDSLCKRLAGCMVQEFRKEREDEAMRKEKEAKKEEEISMQLLAGVHFIQHIPWSFFALSNEVTGFDKKSLVLVPAWEFRRIEVGFQKHGSVKNPDVVEKERDFLAKRLDAVLSSQDKDGLAAVGKATTLLFFHGDDEHVRKLEGAEVPQSIDFIHEYHEKTITCLSPVPKNWAPDLPPDHIALNDVLMAVNCARRVVGECEPIEDIDDSCK